MGGLELPKAGGVEECYLSASGPAILRVRQGHQEAQAEAPHHSRLHRSGWAGLTLCSRLSKSNPDLFHAQVLGWPPLHRIGVYTGMVLTALGYQITEAEDLLRRPEQWESQFAEAEARF